jgi:hypothetical protein
MAAWAHDGSPPARRSFASDDRAASLPSTLSSCIISLIAFVEVDTSKPAELLEVHCY